MRIRQIFLSAALAIAPAIAAAQPGAGALSVPNADPFPSTYKPFASQPTVIRNVNIFTAAGPLIRNGAILIRDGKIVAVGATVDEIGRASCRERVSLVV